MLLKSFRNVVVVSKYYNIKVVCTPFGNIEHSDRLLYPTASCSWGEMNKQLFSDDFVDVYTFKERNINRVGYPFERTDVAPMVKRIDPSELVYFHIWDSDKDWDRY